MFVLPPANLNIATSYLKGNFVLFYRIQFCISVTSNHQVTVSLRSSQPAIHTCSFILPQGLTAVNGTAPSNMLAPLHGNLSADACLLLVITTNEVSSYQG